ncbi:hypothetical protein [Tsukamurella sp. PLM1]|uniref:hypothetical protein n=1 Tax=Tsukamurella sp. PLM1 TaxID=2929795 RepID=UPI0020528D20|nr:hypothetical protein [Tsukamurella sp. PLM1]BDH57416.1 hypothetical protein MTP03_23550 [Tsukamurella sp. PLM1]
MIAVVVVLLGAAALTGIIAARCSPGWSAVPAALLGAAALVALAAPAAQGLELGMVRVAAVVAAMAGGSALVTATFALAGATGQDDPPPVDDDGAQLPPSPLRGGLAIGVLERAAIAVCVLANFSAGLAVIVAAKGLARYPELRHPGAAEQFIIGTFVSVLWAAACAGVAVGVGR